MNRVPTALDFRHCVHQGVAGPNPDHILASIRAEYCLPRTEPPRPGSSVPKAAAIIRPEDFAGLERALGPDAFRQLIGDVLRRRDPGATLAQLPQFLAEHRYGRATPALVDLAALDLALAQSDRAPAAQSIGACCLPPDLLRAHPDLTIAFHPAWRWLALAAPADRWRAELLAQAQPIDAPQSRPTFLRIAPWQGAIAIQRIDGAAFAFERALQRGGAFRLAEAAATTSRAGTFDAVRQVQDLLMAGAVIGVELHPRPMAASVATGRDHAAYQPSATR